VTNQHDEHGTEYSLNISAQTSNTTDRGKQELVREKGGIFPSALQAKFIYFGRKEGLKGTAPGAVGQ
jgi:hypothetical protein